MPKSFGQSFISYYLRELITAYIERDRSKEGSLLSSLGDAYARVRQYQTAIECCKKALTITQEIGDHKGESKALVVLGNVYCDLNRHQEAIQAYKRGLALDPNNPFAHENLAEVYLGLGKLYKAAYHWQHRIALRPEDALAANITLGCIALCQSHETDAQQYFKTALNVWEMVRKNTRVIYSPIHLLQLKAIALLGLGQEEEAIATLKKVLAQRQPDDAIYYRYYSLLSQGPHPPAGLDAMRRLLEQTLKKAPSD